MGPIWVRIFSPLTEGLGTRHSVYFHLLYFREIIPYQREKPSVVFKFNRPDSQPIPQPVYGEPLSSLLYVIGKRIGSELPTAKDSGSFTAVHHSTTRRWSESFCACVTFGLDSTMPPPPPPLPPHPPTRDFSSSSPRASNLWNPGYHWQYRTKCLRRSHGGGDNT